MSKTGVRRTTRSTTSSTRSRAKTTTSSATARKSTAPKTAKSTSASSDVFSISPMSMMTPDAVSVAIPESLRSIAEKTLQQTKVAYETAKDSVEEATDALESTFDLTSAKAKTLNMKLIDFAQSNMETGFDFMRDLACAKDVNEAFSVQSEYVQEQMSTASKQAQEIKDLAEEIAETTAQPLKDHMTKSWSKLQTSL